MAQIIDFIKEKARRDNSIPAKKDFSATQAEPLNKDQSRSGNKCTRCGQFIDETGFCACGFNHDEGIQY